MSTPPRPAEQYNPPPAGSTPGDRTPASPGAVPGPPNPQDPGAPPAQHADHAAAPTSPAAPPPAGFDERGKVKRGRISAAWVGLIAAALLLILLIIFIAQNLNKASIHFLGLSGRAPVGLMLLIAAVAAVLLVAVPGSIRILQLRRALKQNTPKDQRLPGSSR